MFAHRIMMHLLCRSRCCSQPGVDARRATRSRLRRSAISASRRVRRCRSCGSALPHLRHPETDAQGVVRNAVLDHARHGRLERAVRRRRTLPACCSARATARRQPLLHRPARRHRPRPIEQAERRPARASFPHYGYRDMIEAEHRLLTDGLGVNHLRLVMGTSMGGMHTWLWGETYPDFMDALMPLASLPDADLRPQPRVAAHGDRRDPRRSGVEGRRLHHAAARACARPRRCCGWSAATRSSASGRSPTLAQADAVFDDYVANYIKTGDANDTLYALESSRDYDPGPGLERITAPLLAINSADDLVNPPELGILEREITRVPHGRAVVMSPQRSHRRARDAHRRGSLAGLPRRAAVGYSSLASADLLRRSGWSAKACGGDWRHDVRRAAARLDLLGHDAEDGREAGAVPVPVPDGPIG